MENGAKKMANPAVFWYENLQPAKNGIYRGGAAVEQRFCTPLKSKALTGRQSARTGGLS